MCSRRHARWLLSCPHTQAATARHCWRTSTGSGSYRSHHSPHRISWASAAGLSPCSSRLRASSYALEPRRIRFCSGTQCWRKRRQSAREKGAVHMPAGHPAGCYPTGAAAHLQCQCPQLLILCQLLHNEAQHVQRGIQAMLRGALFYELLKAGSFLLHAGPHQLIAGVTQAHVRKEPRLVRKEPRVASPSLGLSRTVPPCHAPPMHQLVC